MRIRFRILFYFFALPALMLGEAKSGFCAPEAWAENGLNKETSEGHLRTGSVFGQSLTFREVLLVELLGLGALFGFQRIRRVERQRERQEAFSQRLIDSQEQERQRIAAELHDGLGQNLLVIKNRAIRGLNQRGAPEKMAEQLAEISAVASEAIREVREIAHNLRPFQLDDLGLVKAMQAMIRSVSEVNRIPIHVVLDELDGVLPSEYEIHLYRVVQECLSNMVKHSSATSASVEARRHDRQIRLMIRDNGLGFTPAATPGPPPEHSGFGLRNLQERVRLMNGTVRIQSAPGAGTTIEVAVPLCWTGALPVSLASLTQPTPA
jgi:signal transduction histidine kinase